MVGAGAKIAVAAGTDEAHLASWTSGGGYGDVPKTKWAKGGAGVGAGSDMSGGGTNCSRKKKAGVVGCSRWVGECLSGRRRRRRRRKGGAG